MAKPTLSPVKGTLDVLVLKALTWSPMHGFEITCWLEQHSAGALGVEDSALYQAVYRLEERGYIEAIDRYGPTAVVAYAPLDSKSPEIELTSCFASCISFGFGLFAAAISKFDTERICSARRSVIINR